jgi:hypothetical protein
MTKARFFKSDLMFVLLFAVFAAFYYDTVLDKGPLNVHLWRQTDCLSMTENYANGAAFGTPEMHIQLGDDNQSGYSAGEFPVLYYSIGNLWKWFGKSHFTYRLFYLIILFGGVFAFYKSLKIVLKDNFWATILALLLFTSPVYAYYGISFLTDGPAFSFILIALYFFVKYHHKQALRFFYLSMLFFALAGLIKVSSLIAFIFLGGILLLETFSVKTLGNKKIYHGLKFEWLGFALAIITIFSWYFYASKFNDAHGFKYTFNDIWPIWHMSWEDVIGLVEGMKKFTSHVFFSRPMLFLLLFTGIINLLLWKKIPLFVYLSNLGIIAGAFFYFILWAPLLGNHDYYYVALLILFVGIIVPFVWYMKTNYPSLLEGRIAKIMAVVFLGFNFLYCLQVMQLKTLVKDEHHLFLAVGDQDFVKHMAWANSYDCENNWYRFERMQPYMRKLGIQKEDRVVSLPDDSFNISLYLMGQKGWTNFNHYSTKEEIQYLIDRGAKYLFISQPEILEQDFLQPFLTQKIGEFEGIAIYKL